MKTLHLTREAVYKGSLLLVNRLHPLHFSDTDALCLTDSRYPGVLMNTSAAHALRACLRAVNGEGRITPVSGWRSRQEQKRIWDESLAENGETFTHSYVAAAGCSEHETGLAIDLGRAAKKIDFIRPGFPDYGVCKHFRREAARFGFIQRYQAGKEELTGISPEPWHFRYVGVPHAMLITGNGLCLEEYTAFLRGGPRGCVLPDGKTATVFYLPYKKETAALELPDAPCDVSGDNQDGFIITIWGKQL